MNFCLSVSERLAAKMKAHQQELAAAAEITPPLQHAIATAVQTSTQPPAQDSITITITDTTATTAANAADILGDSNTVTLHRSLQLPPHEKQLQHMQLQQQLLADMAEAEGFLAGGTVSVGDYVVLLDCDSRMPADCLLDVVTELEQCPEVAFAQCNTQPMQVRQHQQRLRHFHAETLAAFRTASHKAANIDRYSRSCTCLMFLL